MVFPNSGAMVIDGFDLEKDQQIGMIVTDNCAYQGRLIVDKVDNTDNTISKLEKALGSLQFIEVQHTRLQTN